MARTTRLSTRERNSAKREAWEVEQRTKRISEFRTRIAQERLKRTYTDETAWTVGDGDKGATALYEVVHEYERTRENVRRHCESVRDDMIQAIARLARNEHPSYYSYMFGNTASELEQGAGQLRVLAMAIARLAWATGWYVPQIATQGERERRDRFVGIDVVSQTDPLCDVVRWYITLNGRLVTNEDLSIRGEAEEVRPYPYETEVAAWLAAMQYCGEYTGV